MDVTGTPESGNAIATAVRKLGEKFKVEIEEAKRHAKAGLPVVETVLNGESVIREPIAVKDPTKAVTVFLENGEEWKTLHAELKALRVFLEANRHHEFADSRKIAQLSENHPVPVEHPVAAALKQALRDMETIISDKQIVARWPDYRSAYESARDGYHDAYRDAYDNVQLEVGEAVDTIRVGNAYQNAPMDQRDTVVDKVFGPEGLCHYPDINILSTKALLEAAAKHSLTSMAQALMALPGYQNQVEAELRALSEPPTPPGEKTWEWSPGPSLVGRRFKSETQLDEALQAIADEPKKRIREGFTVVVK